MQPFPHVYSVAASGGASGHVALTAPGIPKLMSAAPLEFDGPGDQWSPESLLAAAVSSCFILSFRAVAFRSRLEWTHLECHVDAKLERLDGVTRFTHVVVRAVLFVPESASASMCERALTKAEHTCLVANSLSCSRELEIEIIQGAPTDERLATEEAMS